MSRHSHSLRLIGLILMCMAAMPLYAQFDRGQISGFIKDPSGAFVPGATVTITSEGTGFARSIVTDPNGFYVVPGLDVGYYTITVEMSGFKKYLKEKTKVDANAKVALDITLEIGAQTETVTVSAAAVELQKDTSQLGRIIDSGQIENLVVFGRNPQNLVRLKAGVRGGGTSSGDSNTDGGFNIAGSRGDENVIIQDGAILTRTRSAGQIAGPLNIDTVQEVQVLTTNYAAEYGRSSGGQVRYISKGGTRTFHGGVVYSMRNAALNANSWSRNRSTDIEQSRRPSPFRYNQFGFDLGGPILLPGGINKSREKLFFFYAQEWLRNRSEDSRTWTVPTDLMRQGNFSELLSPTNRFFNRVVTIRDPQTGQNFPGNVIPAGRLSPNGIAFLRSYPAVTPGFAPLGSSNFYEAVPAWANYCKELLKIDWLPSAKHRISFRGSLYQWHTQGRTEANDRPNRSATLSWTWTVRNNLINEANASPTVDVVHIDIAPDNLAKWQKRSQYGINYPYLYPGTKERDDKIPTLSISNISGNDGSRLPLFTSGPIYLFSDTMTWIKGTHMLKWGVVFERSGENDFDQINVQLVPGGTNNQNGRFEFADNRVNGTGLAMANVALGLFNNYGEIGRRAYTPWRATAMDLFVQDSWKMRPNFTVEYGVRYVLWPPWHSLWGNIAHFDPKYYDPAKRATIDRTAGYIVSGDFYDGVVLPGTGWPDAAKGRVNVAADRSFDRLFHGLPDGLAPTHKNVFEPRVGFAYSMNQKTVVRMGVGMFHNRTLLNDSTLLGGNPPIQPMSGVSDGQADAPGGSVRRDFPLIMTANPYDFNHPTAWAWNLTVQRQMPWGITVESAYVARRAYRQPRERNINQLQLGERYRNPGVNTEFLRPYHGMGIVRMSEHAAHSWYHGFQNEINRRFRNGMGFGISYTWSKTTSNADGKRDILTNAYDDRSWKGISNQDRTHLFIANWVYDIPFLKGTQNMFGKVLGGWQIAGVAEYSTGSPFSVARGDDVAGVGTGSGAQAWNSLQSAKIDKGQWAFSEGTTDNNLYFNPCTRLLDGTTRYCYGSLTPAWSQPANGTWGNAARNLLYNPGSYNWDLSAIKKFRLTEGKYFQLRADMFNFLNHPNWSGPTTDPNSAFFGRVTGKGGNRQIQVTGTIRF